jgi:hypothetical protein
MKPDDAAMKLALKKREAELQKLIRQMKDDKLDQSKIYKNLEDELTSLKNRFETERNPHT